ncbi:ATP-binding cassette domain-containing protein [Scardovia wiggsiae]|uniref:ATP-binding cassette domain-containing protein n=1 Tax=Scardovia wiggsiae TaxID=230143 RepID=UPI00374FA507
MIDKTPLADVRHLNVTLGFSQALKDVSFTIEKHEVLAIVGDNGAGKSTLIKVLSGLVQPDSGTITWKGEAARIPSIHDAIDMGIASMFQDVEFCDNLDVAANIFLGTEISAQMNIRQDERMHLEARKVLNAMNSSISVYSPISALSAGQRQTVALARMLLNDPSLVLLDEPTASLSVIQTAETLNHIRSLRAGGKSVVFICHTLPDVFAVSDRIAIMRHGRITGVYKTSETTYQEVIARIAGVSDFNGLTAEQKDGLKGQAPVNRKLIDRYAEASVQG